MDLRTDWTLEEVADLYHLPLFELVSTAHKTFKKWHNGHIQCCELISVKTGGCEEDCNYCAQSARYSTSVKAEPLLPYETVIARAKRAKEQGVARICLGVAWRQIRDGVLFEKLLAMVEGISALGLEVCATFGMLEQSQAKRLKEAGLFSYSHNLDTSRSYYPSVITTRTFEERLKTLNIIRDTGLSVCCGGILGLGESEQDRIELLHTFATFETHPDSVPINLLSKVEGTPFFENPEVPFWDFLRTIATARLLMPKAMVRLSAGRKELSLEKQLLCFFAGANSLHVGTKLLTVGNNAPDTDASMFSLFGLKKQKPYEAFSETYTA